MEEERPDLVPLDLMKEILEVAEVPGTFLSACGADEFVACPFEQGAVDYVGKPLSPTELAARIKAAQARTDVFAAEVTQRSRSAARRPGLRAEPSGNP